MTSHGEIKEIRQSRISFQNITRGSPRVTKEPDDGQIFLDPLVDSHRLRIIM